MKPGLYIVVMVVSTIANMFLTLSQAILIDTREPFDYNIASFTGIVPNCPVSSSCNYKSDYSSLLEQSNKCMFHVRNLQALMTEIDKTIADLNPTFMKEIFIRKDTPYRLKCNRRLKIPSVRTISYGTTEGKNQGSSIFAEKPPMIER